MNRRGSSFAWVLALALMASGCGDNIVPELCGNGRLDVGETCDDSNELAPCDCDDLDVCTVDSTAGGAAASCSLTCTNVLVGPGIDDGVCCITGDVTDPDCGSACGNGIVDTGEECDIAIATGTGSCPADCDDAMACTEDTLTGVGCSAVCTNTMITTPGADDGCCLEGSSYSTDQDCPIGCGNGFVDPGETCDTDIATGAGSCPDAADCADGDSCTTDSVISAGTCTDACLHVDITATVDGDSCCPAGANGNTDSDCSSACGNGALESGEQCDTAIPAGTAGSCPTAGDCNDGDSCTADSFSGAGCVAACTNTTITATGVNDGCCPAAGNANNDPNCLAVCGNGVLESSAGEACDTGLAGSCPASAADCNDGNACTTQSVSGVGCGTTCAFTPVTACAATADGCCPPGCTGLNDGDCSLTCGNGLVEASETCDTAIASGPGSCPDAASCNDGVACTSDGVQSAGTCNASCVNTPITATINGDGCCPLGADANTDTDCPAICGNGVTEPGETCDTAAGDCPTSCSDGDSCTEDTLVNGGTCNATCPFTPIVPCCGNGVQDGTETCDVNAAAGSGDECPTTCVGSDPNPCTTDTLTGTACDVFCAHTPQPEPCCGDGIVTGGAGLPETCDDSYPGGPVAIACTPATVLVDCPAGDTCTSYGFCSSTPRPCSSITCIDGIACTSDTPLNLGSACRKICPHAAINDPGGAGVADGCCPPQSRFGDDADCTCGDSTPTAVQPCDDGNTTNNDVCTNSCTLVDNPFVGPPDPAVAEVIGAPCTGSGFDAGNCSYLTNGNQPVGAVTLCITPATLPEYTGGVVNGACSTSAFTNPCDPTTTDSAGDADFVPENIDSCPQLATLAQIQGGMASPNALCVELAPGLPVCVALCSVAAGQNLCRRTELGPFAGVIGPALGGWAYRCMPVSATAGICVPRDPTF